MRLAPLAAVLLASAALAAPLAAQSGRVTIRVVDEASRSPLPSMGVVLRGTQFQGVTGGDGTVTFASVPYGSYTLELRDGSGNPHQSSVTVRRPEVAVTLSVRPGATALDPLVVTAMTEQRRAMRASGTARRVLDREYIQQNLAGKRHVGALLQGRVPGLRVFETLLPPSEGSGPRSPRLCIESGRRHQSLQRRACWMVAVYVDGMRIQDPGQFLLSFPLESVESVELLSPVQATTRYGSAAALGVLEIFTRGNGPHARRDEQ